MDPIDKYLADHNSSQDPIDVYLGNTSGKDDVVKSQFTGQASNDPIDQFATAVGKQFGPEASKAAKAQAQMETSNGTQFPMGATGPGSATYNFGAWGGVSDDNPGHPAYNSPEEGAQGFAKWVTNNPRYSKYIQDAQAGADAATLLTDLYGRYTLPDGSVGGGWAESPTALEHVLSNLKGGQ